MSEQTIRENVDLLLSVSQLHRGLLDRKATELGIPGGQYMILRRLAACEEKVKQRDLADYFQVTAAAIANSLRRMEKKGFVSRCSSDIDTRCNRIDITDAGLDKLNTANAAFEKIDEQLFADFTPEEMEVFGSVLKRLQERLHGMGAE